MQHLDKLWKVIHVAGQVRDIAQEVKQWTFLVQPPVTFYCHAEAVDLVIKHHTQPEITLKAEFQLKMSWRIQTDQDHAGVYVVAKRLPLIGTMARLRLEVGLPYETFLALRLEGGNLTLAELNGELHLPPVHPPKNFK